MKKNSMIALLILWWAEVVVSVRVLFFTVPVIISEIQMDEFSPYVVDDWLILVVTIAAFLYAAVGVVSLLGHRLWRQFHYLVTALIFFLSIGMFNRMLVTGVPVLLRYFTPLFISIVNTALLILRVLNKTDNAKWQSVLVVDDDEGLLTMIRPMLIKEGFSVLTALTGEEGLDIAQKQVPDIIILDVLLPGIKGREVCVKLKEDPRTKHIPVVFLTAKSSEDDIKAELEAGGELHITKPYERKEIVATVKRILAKPKLNT